MEIQVNMEIEVNEVVRLGNYSTNRNRPILVKLSSFNRKRDILKAAKKLKGTKIYITEDFPKKIQEERKFLIEKMKEARQEGNRAYVVYNKLIINSTSYKVQQLSEDQQAKICSIHNQNIKNTETRANDSQIEKIRKKGARTVDERSPQEVKMPEIRRPFKLIKQGSKNE
ncbi:hypothetical protein RN001_000336 [Aquatica leii]|uniref:Endonuclease-reverse transcriptase n=1 Tax=Aquatica leii TaxID=1421715 RepID=A0AAN7P9S6_9COLE|nr:hypothetical protein RN001_000336 [Aquatica leii]